MDKKNIKKVVYIAIIVVSLYISFSIVFSAAIMRIITPELPQTLKRMEEIEQELGRRKRIERHLYLEERKKKEEEMDKELRENYDPNMRDPFGELEE